MTKTYTCVRPGCGTLFPAKTADRKRGWGRHCSRSCAAWTREKKLDRRWYYERKPAPADHTSDHDIGMAAQEIAERGY